MTAIWVTKVIPSSRAAIVVLLVHRLLHEHTIQFDVAVIHDKVLGHEAFQSVPIDHVKGAMLSQASHQLLDTLLVRFPLLDVALDLHLSLR